MPRKRENVTDQITASEAARRLGLTAQGLAHWIRQAGCPKVANGNSWLLQWPEFARWRENELVRNATEALRAKAEEKPRGLDEAVERKAIADAELAEARLAKVRGEQVSRAESERTLAAVMGALESTVRGFRPRYAQQCVGLATVHEAAAVLDRAAAEMLNALQAAVVDLPDDDEDTANTEQEAA